MPGSQTPSNPDSEPKKVASVDLEAALRSLKNVDDLIANLPHIHTITDVSVKIIEIKDRLATNKKLCYRIIERVARYSTAMAEAFRQAKQRGVFTVEDCEQDLRDYKSLLEDIHHNIHRTALTGIYKIPGYFKSDDAKENLQSCLTRLDHFDSIFEVSQLLITLCDADVSGASTPLSNSLANAASATVGNVEQSADKTSLVKHAISTSAHATSANLPVALKVLKDIAESLKNVPYIKTIAGLSIQMLEIREQVENNKNLADHLIDHVAARSIALLRALHKTNKRGEIRLDDLEYDLRRYEKLLVDIHNSLRGLTGSSTGLRKITTIVNRDDIKKKLQDYSTQLTEFDSIFNFSRLTSIEVMVHQIQVDLHAQSAKPLRVPKAVYVPPPSRIFTGREEVLAKMAEYFEPSQSSPEQRVYVLYGLGGAGKTQIALKFIKDHAEQFSKTYFIDASSVQTINTALENIGSDAQLFKPTVAVVLQMLGSLNEEWLLFFDNADDPSLDLYSYFPPCTHGNILVTSRNPQMRLLAPQSHHHVGILEQHEALQLLRSSSMCDNDKEDASLLVQELGHLAFAVAQAGAYIGRSPGMTFKRYMELYKVRQADLLRQKPGQSSDNYEWTVYTAWEISFQKLTPLAAQLLQLFSFWHYDNIPKAAFQNPMGNLDSLPDGWEDAAQFLQNFATSTGDWDDFAFQEVLNELASLSLLSSHSDDAYSMHPLVHFWARDRSGSNDRQLIGLCAGHLLGLSIRWYDSNEPELRIPFWQAIVAHIQSWIRHQPHWSASQDPDLAIQFARVYSEKGWWKEAEEMELAVLKTWRKTLGEKHPNVLASMNNLASTYSDQGRWQEAADLHEAVLKTKKKVLGKKHPQTLISMGNLASTYRMQGKWAEAEKLEAAVLSSRREVMGVEHLHTLISMANLAATYQKQGRWVEAEELQTAILATRRKVLGEEDPHTLNSMINLAWTYRELRKLKEAEELETAALETQKKVLGPEHPHTLESMASLAETYQEQSRWKEAEDLGIAVLDMRRKVLGTEHPDTLLSMNDLAATYETLGRWQAAEELAAAVLGTSTKILGSEHPDTLLSMDNLAVMYLHHGRWRQAEELQTTAVSARRKIAGDEHPGTLTSMHNLAATYQKRGKWKEAEELQIVVLNMRRKVLGNMHPQTFITMGTLATTYRSQGRLKEAEELEVAVLDGRRKVLGEEHTHTLFGMANLASTYRKQGKSKEAEELDVAVLDARKKVLGNEHPDTLTSMTNLGSTYLIQGKWKEAEALVAAAFGTQRRVLGAEHPSTLTGMAKLAEIYWKQGRSNEAQDMGTLVLEMRKKALGDEHPDTIESKVDLATYQK